MYIQPKLQTKLKGYGCDCIKFEMYIQPKAVYITLDERCDCIQFVVLNFNSYKNGKFFKRKSDRPTD